MPHLPFVAICVATYKRPQYLHDLLKSMQSIQLDGFRAHLIVVDNDPTETARPTVEEEASTFPIPVIYVVESTRGIASVRNTLVAHARTLNADYLVFVDDDELVDPGWLRELIRVAEMTDADAVSGQVVFRFEADVPIWVRKGVLLPFSHPELQTAMPANTRGTGNLLLRIRSLELLPRPFDERFNLTGGSDAHFLTRFRREGTSVVGAPKAIVYERIGPSRTTWRWFLKRGFRYGVTHMRIAKDVGTSVPQVALQMVKALLLVGRSFLLIPPCTARHGRAGLANQLWVGSAAVGTLIGFFGVTYSEYKQIHGQ